ncbi:YadA-like family protein [Novilysobacter arseniciresistens]|uniref:YadA-like family protein n=1 Tax=Novilysobacter arseniciresistens TaxID=1385522 RepID=UPI000AFE9E94|nr:YadA-like family protein [Lysobacter arseniciresistens]
MNINRIIKHTSLALALVVASSGAFAQSICAETPTATATGVNAHACGMNASANGTNSLANGSAATADGESASAYGTFSQATGYHSFAFGAGAIANGFSALAVGDGANAIGDQAASFGAGAIAGAEKSLAVGNGANAGAYGAAAIGLNANVSGVNGVGIGTAVNVYGTDGVGIGSGAQAGFQAIGIGVEAAATGDGTVSIGSGSVSSGIAAAAFGVDAEATHDYSVALGAGTRTTQYNEVAVGNRKVTQVAAGTDPTDAVNVSQMQPFAAALGGGSNFNGGVFTAPNYGFISGAVYNNVGDALADLDSRVYDLEQNPGGGGTGPQGPAGDSAYQVAVNNGYAGSETEWLASLKGEQGERGEQGIAGEPGTGSTEPGPEGPAGQDGVDGIDGRSAYEVAIENGFDGTEEEWLASLEGADGRDGRDGKDGAGKKLNGGSNIAVSDNEDGSQTASLKDNVQLSDQGSVNVGATTVNAQGVSIAGGPSMTTNGIDAGNQRVRNVADGRIEQGSRDAVNGGQIWALEQDWNDRWTEINHRVDGLEGRIDAVGAQSAAMAQMSAAGTYLPVGKVAINAGYGQYGTASALAVGVKVRFSERTSGSLGFSASDDGKLMIGAGFSLTLP